MGLVVPVGLADHRRLVVPEVPWVPLVLVVRPLRPFRRLRLVLVVPVGPNLLALLALRGGVAHQRLACLALLVVLGRRPLLVGLVVPLVLGLLGRHRILVVQRYRHLPGLRRILVVLVVLVGQLGMACMVAE